MDLRRHILVATEEAAKFEQVAWRHKVVFHVNSRRIELDDAQPHHTLLRFLRDSLGLTGTKLGCGEGGCGACTVMVSYMRGGSPVHHSVNACLAPLCAVDGCHVTSVEGIRLPSGQPHPVQDRIVKMHGSQCGYCTPGIVMSLYSTLRNNPSPTLADFEMALDGNLCRCTGYRPILDAARTFACDKVACPIAGVQTTDMDPASEGNVTVTSTTASLISKFDAFDSSADPPSLDALYDSVEMETEPLAVIGQKSTWLRPTSLQSLLTLKAVLPFAKLVGGNTELGIESKLQDSSYMILISVMAVQELHQLSFDSSGALVVGGAVTLSCIEHFIEESLNEHSVVSMRGFKAMLDMLRWFAGDQIRNVAVLAGNLATASPISDMNPVLMALDATVTLARQGAEPREVPVRQFFKNYRVTVMEETEIITSIRIPPTADFQFVRSFKQARRRSDDISLVNACFHVELEAGESGWVVKCLSAALGGMAATTKRALKCENTLKGKIWSEEALADAYAALAEDLPIKDEGAPGGMPAYRQTLVASFFYKFYVGVSLELANCEGIGSKWPPAPPIQEADKSAEHTYLTVAPPLTHGTQRFSVPEGGLQHTSFAASHDHQPASGQSRKPVGQPHIHRSSLLQCTGEAIYVDDMPSISGTLHAALVLSTRAKAKIKVINHTDAIALPGVVSFFSAADLTNEQNQYGLALEDEQVFRKDTVEAVGQVIGLVVAETVEIANQAAKCVSVEYEDIDTPPVLTIDDAIKNASFSEVLNPTSGVADPTGDTQLRCLVDGDVESAFTEPGNVIVQGDVRVGGQEHFYLETHAAHCIPGEGDELTIYASTQAPGDTQMFAAKACGIPLHKVVAKVKRIGGGFGGKESRSMLFSTAIALAAHRLRKPVKISIDRDIDMLTTGTRHPFLARYKAAATPDGMLRGLDVKLYNNAGYSMDLSGKVMGQALRNISNAYKFANVRAEGHVCMTNTASNTAFRGFGSPQGMMVAETCILHLATVLKLHPDEIRRKNMYQDGDKTPYKQILDKCPLRRMWDELIRLADVDARRAQVNAFNNANRWRKHGIAVLPTMFGINFDIPFLNQAGALLHVYKDGTVLLTHGGIEMGQGLHTKTCQIAARALNIPLEDVFVSETASDKVPNATCTAASVSSDFYGMATLNACEQIMARLAPKLEACGGDFKKAVVAAYFDCIDLSAHGFYKATTTGHSFSTPTDPCKLFNYYTCGVACSEVEVDVLTGDMRITRADIVMDLGNSLNPAIDIGQIEGAFMQGVGWCTTEEVICKCDEFPWMKSGSGARFTRGPSTYKIPAFNDVPVDFRVTILKNNPNSNAVHSSRAVGEPPFFMGTSAFFATRNAIAAARADAGSAAFFVLEMPLTAERIRMACSDELSAAFAGKMSRGRPCGFW